MFERYEITGCADRWYLWAKPVGEQGVRLGVYTSKDAARQAAADVFGVETITDLWLLPAC